MVWVRQYLPVWIIGVAASFALPGLPAWYWPVALSAVLLAAAPFFRAAVFLSVFMLGLCYGVGRTQYELSKQWPAGNPRTEMLTVRVAGLPQYGEKRVRFEARTVDGHGNVRTVLLSDYALRDWPAGSVWRIKARMRAPVGEANPGGFDREAWALAHGFHGIGTVGKERQRLPQPQMPGMAEWRAKISANWQKVAGYGEGVGLLRALSIGEQNALPDKAWQAFRPLGLTHLVSISGLHVTMVGMMAAWIVRFLLRFVPLAFKRPRTVVSVCAVFTAFSYALLAGFSVPTQRTVLMLAAFAWFWHSGRQGSGWFAWWTALGAVLFFDPAAVLGIGTWLSFGLVAALLWCGSWRLEETGGQLFWRAQYAVIPVSVLALGSAFSSLPLLSPLVNLLAIPWFSWVLVPLALVASALPFAPLQIAAAALADYTMRLLYWLGGSAPEWSVAAAPPGLFLAALAAVCLLLLPRGLGLRPWALLVLAGFVFYRLPPMDDRALEVRVWDVGQGLALSFHTRHKTLLFDTGTGSAAATQLVPGLRALGVRRLDALVLSHHDGDHDGGAPDVAEIFKPAAVWAGQPRFYPGAVSCRTHRFWEWDGVRFEFLSLSENGGVADNAQSCILRVVAAGKALLVTGDLDRRGERDLMARYGGSIAGNVLVLGHHGSDSASSGAFLNAVSSQYAVASSGFANAYGHPARAVRTRLAAHGIRLLRTDRGGAWRIVFAENRDVAVENVSGYRPYWRKKPFAECCGSGRD